VWQIPISRRLRKSLGLQTPGGKQLLFLSGFPMFVPSLSW
jgi:hypothetical protein